MKTTVQIRPLLESEVPLVQEFVPMEWQFDLGEFVRSNWNESYFRVFACMADGQLAGTGNVIINGDVGWIGNIIVEPSHRSNGIGFQISRYLVDYLRSNGCKSLVLIASEAGKPMYQKLGFLTSSVYCFLKGSRIETPPDMQWIRPIHPSDMPALQQMDKLATGEERFAMLEKKLDGGWVYCSEKNNNPDGFYLPAFGNGLILASNGRAGLGLLHLKHHRNEQVEVIPCDNKMAVEFLKHHHFREFMLSPRMVLGEEVSWHPEMIYSRAGGYCG